MTRCTAEARARVVRPVFRHLFLESHEITAFGFPIERRESIASWAEREARMYCRAQIRLFETIAWPAVRGRHKLRNMTNNRTLLSELGGQKFDRTHLSFVNKTPA